jgi:hypothetical protein
MLEALLQSPHFLYRPELSDTVEKNVMPLSGFEVANRLSYALWHTMPDDALFAAAASGELATKEGLATQARRLLRAPRAQDTVASFHDQLLQLQKVFDVTRAHDVRPRPDAGLAGARHLEPRVERRAPRGGAPLHGRGGLGLPLPAQQRLHLDHQRRTNNLVLNTIASAVGVRKADGTLLDDFGDPSLTRGVLSTVLTAT